MEVFFNELSVRLAVSDFEAKSWIETISEVGKVLKDVSESLSGYQFKLRCSEEFNQLPIRPTKNILEFLQEQYDFGDAIFNFFLGVFDSPYIAHIDSQRTAYEYMSLTFDNTEYSVTGLVAAHVKGALAVSFNSDAIWDSCQYNALINKIDSSVKLSSSVESIDHASTKSHIVDCHLSLLANSFLWHSYHPKPTLEGILPLLTLYGLYVESWEIFYKTLFQKTKGEQVSIINTMASRIAAVQRWVPAIGSLKTRNSDRTIYTIPNSDLIVSVDTQHGEFEIFDSDGSNHLGAISFDGKRIKDPIPNRRLKS